MSKQILQHIDELLIKSKFKKTFVAKGQRVYALGDNGFEKTKRFARFSIVHRNEKYSISAMTAVADTSGGNGSVSRMDWVESAKVSESKFDEIALKICMHLLAQIRKKARQRDDKHRVNIG